MTSIPASAIVNVTPNVLSAGGSALDLSGIVLTNSVRVPIGSVTSFANEADVADHFGASSDEAAAAATYFLGFDNSNVKPGAMLFTQYPSTAVGAYLRGGDLSAMTLSQLQAITPGTLTITTDGTPLTSSSINLSGATSFSNAASIIATAFTTPPFGVSYDSVLAAFVFTSTATGSTHVMIFPSNTIATPLKLTAATGAVLSSGADAATPTAFMDALTAESQNWASFMTLFNPDGSGNANKLLFAQWCNNQDDRYVYVCWDTDSTPTGTVPATTSLGYLLQQSNSSGTFLIYTLTFSKAAFALGIGASIDFAQTNGRATYKFRSQTGQLADVTNQTIGNNLTANGYNYYGAWATANDQFVGFAEGSISGPFLWADSFIDQIWLNNQFQLALMTLLFNEKSIPYNSAGYGKIEAACTDVINAGLNFGAFRPGISLSAQQIANVNNAAGKNITGVLQTRGWYLQVQDASPQVRAARGSPPCTFWYIDGQSVQQINLTSIEIQ